MKIYSDSLQDKIDEYEKSKVGYKEKIILLQEVFIYVSFFKLYI